jgi:hypothetical protein
LASADPLSLQVYLQLHRPTDTLTPTSTITTIRALVSHYSHFACNKYLTTMALFPDSTVEQRREALKHHDDYNAAVVARLAFLAEHPEHAPVAKPKPTTIPMPRISEDAALAVIDMQGDFCPPVYASNYLSPFSRP